jgi:3-hydroxybutyryl-CoA dehydrogenase
MPESPESSEVRPWPRRAAVIGSGTMGAGIAQLLCLADVDVSIVDVALEQAQAARERSIQSVEAFERAGMMPTGAAATVGLRLRASESISTAVADAQFVLEAVTEDPATKLRVYAEIEAAASDRCVVASNTSAIPIRDLARGFTNRARFLGTHWFNPPQWVPCVEVIPTPDTAAGTVDQTHALLRRLGKEPVTVGDAAGFVANRIQFAMFKEAASCVADGVATPEQVDAVVRSSFGFRLPFFGPFEIADMAGLDVYAGAYAALEADLGSRFAPPESVVEHVSAGRLGAKTGGAYLPPDPNRAARRDKAYFALSSLLDALADRD